MFVGNARGGYETKPASIEERLVKTVLNRHDEVDHLLAHAPGDYYPIFMQDNGIVDAWAIGFALRLGRESWAPTLLATPKPIITPIMAVNPQLAKMRFRLSLQEKRKVRATGHLHIRAAVTHLCAVTRAKRQ
jgi:hypothetical protein